jgi:hypothetical protein
VAEAERLAHRYSLVVQRAAQKVERDASAASAAEEAVAAAVAKQRQQDEALAAKRAIAEAQAARLQREQTEAAAAAAAEAHGAALDAAWQHVSDFARSSDRGAVGAFGTFDADGSGTLETAEFRRALEASGALELVLTDEVRKRGRGGLRVSG